MQRRAPTTYVKRFGHRHVSVVWYSSMVSITSLPRTGRDSTDRKCVVLDLFRLFQHQISPLRAFVGDLSTRRHVLCDFDII